MIVLCRRILSVALFVVFVCPVAALATEEAATPRYRALLVACDDFVEAADMQQIGEHSLNIMETVLKQDTREFEVTRQYGITSSAEALGYIIGQVFRDATEDDTSLLYISTHGVFDTTHNNPHGALILSDGALEDRVTAHELNTMLDKVPGKKVLLVDACNSGALIGKGVSPEVGSARVARTFQSKDYKILTSSGASEPSWYLLSTLEYAPPGSSYFTTALAVGAGLIGGYAADENRDGIVTLREMYDYLWVNQASSAVQMYPQNDEFPLFVYNKANIDEETNGELTGFVFGSRTLDAKKPVLEFGYTATASTRVAYRITYLRNGQWDWVNGVTIRDETEFDGDADPMGDITPGRKQIALALDEVLPEDWTYGMIHIMTIGKASEGEQPFIYASRVFSAKQQAGEDPKLSIRASGNWNMKNRPELEVFVAHDAPCGLTVVVEDDEGEMVCRLATSKATRPQSLEPDGSLFYWNGLDADGEKIQPGDYTIKAKARVGGKTYEALAVVTVK